MWRRVACARAGGTRRVVCAEQEGTLRYNQLVDAPSAPSLDVDAPAGTRMTVRLKTKLQQLIDGFSLYPSLVRIATPRRARADVLCVWCHCGGGGGRTTRRGKTSALARVAGQRLG